MHIAKLVNIFIDNQETLWKTQINNDEAREDKTRHNKAGPRQISSGFKNKKKWSNIDIHELDSLQGNQWYNYDDEKAIVTFWCPPKRCIWYKKGTYILTIGIQ